LIEKTLTFHIPRHLLDIVYKRAELKGRSRSAEFRFLLYLALKYVGDGDIDYISTTQATQTSPNVKYSLGLDYTLQSTIESRSHELQRPQGAEVLRLVNYALEMIKIEEFRKLVELTQLLDGGAVEPPESEQYEFPLDQLGEPQLAEQIS